MLVKIILPIKPSYVSRILNGTKRYEFRTKVSKRDISKILIYETTPTKKVVAEVEIIDVLEMRPDDLWKETEGYGGISKRDYDKYFLDREVAYAYKLGKVTKFEEPKELIHYGINHAPQSFVYIR